MGYMGEKDSWIDWTVHYWVDWLNERLGERQQVFLSDPDELTASFFREKSSESGYRGHELIELIQNADDAGIGYSAPNRLLIRLTEVGLFVANTGIPFSPEGIKSLMVSDNSPKQLLRTKCIGYKGLGFRSILGWASSIIILSGKLSIGFNEKFAENWLSNLRKRDQRVDIKVKKYEALGYPAPIATLSTPYLITPESRHLEAELNSIYEEGRKILADGYDTVICLLFKNAQKTHEQVQKQINLLGREILLFLQFLERIEIQSPGRNECLTVERKEDEILLNPDITTPEIWKIFKKEGDIPKEYLKPEQILHDKYEIKLAISSKPVDVNRLFVFFPTEVRFPFPIIVHATFEVSDNRQNLIDSEVNRYISEELANLMAESAEKIKDIGNPWYALSTISPTGDIDPVLEKFIFFDTLLQRVKAYALIPVRNNAFETSSKSKRIRGNFDNSLTGEIFHDLCIYVDDPSITKQLQRLGVDYIDYDDLRERLNRISGILTINDRVELVYLLIENSIINGEPPELLIDESGEKIVAGVSIFLPPEAKVFSLPNWVPQRLLNSEMTALLKAKFSVSRVRDLASTLKPFNVDEYNLNSLVSSIQAETNRNCKDNPEEELSLRKQTIQVIWNLYSSSEEKVKLRDEITIILPTRNGNFESAKDLYFGKEYENGRILECLYAHIDPNSFVASPEKLGFVNTSKEIEEFLSWVGVSKSPRYISVDTDYSKRDFLDYVMFSLKYPARFSEIAIENVQQLRECYKTLREVTNIDRIEQVISTADPHAIICWIATNPDVDSWRIDGDNSATFEIKRSGQQNYRRLLNQSVPSYPLWLLRTTAWLPIEGGNKLSPNKCCIAPGARDISQVVGYPALDMEHPLIKALNLDRTAIISALIKIGVVTDLDTLPWDSFYEILLELPTLDQQGGKAKSIYRKLFGRSENDIDPSGQKYQEFMNKGKMLGRKNGELKYFPINRLYYLESITLPDKIQEQYPLVEIDRRRGASKVKKLFGIEQLTRDKIQIEVLSSEEHPCAQNFQSEIDRIKPHIYALRVEEDADRVQLNALRKLKINLCRSVRVAMVVDNERQEIELQDGDSINIDSEAYLVAQPDYTNTFLLEAQKIADPVGEIISNIFKVDMNDKIARILTCPPTDRDWILDRIVGGSGAERLGKSKEIFKITVDDKEPYFRKPPTWQPPIEPGQKEKGEEILKPESIIAPDLVGEVSVIDKGVIIPLPKKIVIRKVQLNPKTDTPLRARKVVNPDRAENLAIEFEKEGKRCPMKISHITGYDSFGCDILSFKSESDLGAFQQNNDLSLVDRFIEVKGRSSEKGSVTLKGNQLRSAQAYKERFFIYRIYEEEKTGIFDLVMINDPLSCEKDALEPQYEINPFRSAKSHLWEVEEKDVASLNEQVN